MSERVPMSPERLAAEISDFVSTNLGEHYVRHISLQYNLLHQEAESEQLTPAQKAAKVDRAAGLKLALDFLTTGQAMHASIKAKAAVKKSEAAAKK